MLVFTKHLYINKVEALTLIIINTERGAHQAPNDTLTLFLFIDIPAIL